MQRLDVRCHDRGGTGRTFRRNGSEPEHSRRAVVVERRAHEPELLEYRTARGRGTLLLFRPLNGCGLVIVAVLPRRRPSGCGRPVDVEQTGEDVALRPHRPCGVALRRAKRVGRLEVPLEHASHGSPVDSRLIPGILTRVPLRLGTVPLGSALPLRWPTSAPAASRTRSAARWWSRRAPR